MNLIQIKVVVLFVSFSILSHVPKSQSNNSVVGTYVFVDTTNINCRIHRLTINADSSYEYTSDCQNSYGKWQVKNNKLLLYFDLQKTYGSFSDFGYNKNQNEVIIRLWGKSTHAEFSLIKGKTVLVPTKPIKPLVCEEVVCWLNGKDYVAFTNSKGEAIFNKINEVDSFLLKSLYLYNYSKGITFGTITKAKHYPNGKINSCTLYFPCHSDYHRFIQIKNYSIQMTPQGLKSEKKSFINGVMPKGNWVKK